jgi:SAM-dependent methyltransferase
MLYDPVKNVIMKAVREFPLLRRVFFLILDMLFLRQWYVKRQIRRHFKRNEVIKFYDAGAGFCQYSDFILSNWKKSTVFALDLKEDYLKTYSTHARSKYPERFSWIKSDLVYFVPEIKYNLIAAIDILEHIDNDIQVLKNFYACLLCGGKLIISTPSDLDEASQFTSEHVRPGYALDNLLLKLTDVGFAIVFSGFSYGQWGALSWKLAVKIPLSLMSYSKILLILLPIYYICLYPLIYLLMLLDVYTIKQKGTGIIIVAEKPFNAS